MRNALTGRGASCAGPASGPAAASGRAGTTSASAASLSTASAWADGAGTSSAPKGSAGVAVVGPGAFGSAGTLRTIGAAASGACSAAPESVCPAAFGSSSVPRTGDGLRTLTQGDALGGGAGRAEGAALGSDAGLGGGAALEGGAGLGGGMAVAAALGAGAPLALDGDSMATCSPHSGQKAECPRSSVPQWGQGRVDSALGSSPPQFGQKCSLSLMSQPQWGQFTSSYLPSGRGSARLHQYRSTCGPPALLGAWPRAQRTDSPQHPRGWSRSGLVAGQCCERRIGPSGRAAPAGWSTGGGSDGRSSGPGSTARSTWVVMEAGYWRALPASPSSTAMLCMAVSTS